MKKVKQEARFNRFYQETYEKAMVYCLAKTGDFVNGEDLLADVYYAIYKRLLKGKEQEIGNLEAYLFTVLKNRIAKYWKRHRRELVMTAAANEEEGLEQLLCTDFQLTEETAIQKMLLQDILEYVSGSQALMRRAFTLHFYLGKTVEETALELEIPVTTARNYIYRLLREVRERFLEEYE